jgi:hypothetical protein
LKGGEKRRARPEPEPGHQGKEQGGLGEDQRRKRQADQHCRQGRLTGEADRQKEPDQKQVLEPENDLGEFVRLRVAGDQHPEDERPEIPLDPGHFEKLCTAQRQHETVENQKLVVANAAQQTQEQRA